ncbi:hypothetical protein F5Y17DRAFT_457972 [Xylariaceae sp. FL0594]|nr:hypothetical protein F5Y17DRAFT_457972 [Xylariaceae sp. FL0594]
MHLFLALVPTAAAAACKEPPSWTIQNLNITTRDEVGSTGTAAFAFTYNLTNATEPVACPLHSNYRCTVSGTRADASTVIDLQIGLGTVYLSVVQTVDCDGEGGGTTFVGNAELGVECTTVQFDTHVCLGKTATLQGAENV